LADRAALDPLRSRPPGEMLDHMKAIELALPKSVWPYWLLSAAVVVGLPLTSFVYFPALLQTGKLPVNGDSISIPMFSSIMFALLITPVIFGVTYSCVRTYRAKGTFMIWRRDRPILSSVLSILFGLPVAALMFSIGQTAIGRYPDIEFIWIPYTLVCVAWLMALRAAALASAKPGKKGEHTPL
jgi:hypothetical protein